MNILDTVLFGMLAGLVTLKVTLLAAAAVLLVHGLTAHIRQHNATPVKAPLKHPGMDVHA